jgi:hypothetical protein
MCRPPALRSGVRVPPNTRTASDVPELHRPWSAAIATGLLRISDGMVASGHALEGWPPGDAVLLDAWFAGLRAVCEALADPRQEDGFTGMLVFALALLTVLEDEEGRRAKSYGRRCWNSPMIFATPTIWTCCQPRRCGAPAWRVAGATPPVGDPGSRRVDVALAAQRGS